MAKKKGAVKKEIPKSYKKLQELAQKARVEVKKILKLVGKEADLGSKILKSKIDIINLDTKVDKKYRDLGKDTYELVEKGKLTKPQLKNTVVEINDLYRAIEKKRKEINRLKAQMKKTAKS